MQIVRAAFLRAPRNADLSRALHVLCNARALSLSLSCFGCICARRVVPTGFMLSDRLSIYWRVLAGQSSDILEHL